MGRKKSIVWNHFKIPESDSTKAICNYCSFPVGRGQKNMGTTSLMNHLRRCKQLKARFSYHAMNLSAEEAPAESSVEVVQEPNTEEYYREADASYTGGENNVRSSASLILPPPPEPLTNESFIQEYHSNGKPSVLLYGDITSTCGRPYEEPSSSNNPDPEIPPNSTDITTNSATSYLLEYIASDSTVEFLHGGIILHMLYEQYKKGTFCDLQLVTKNPRSSEGTISKTGKIIHTNVGNIKNELKVHSCLLAALSKKIEVMVQMGCSTIQLKRGSYTALRGLMEIVYTGKLEKISTQSVPDVREILEVAQFLEVDMAEKYLLKQRPDITENVPDVPSVPDDEAVNRNVYVSPLSLVQRTQPEIAHPRRTYKTARRKPFSTKNIYSRTGLPRFAARNRRNFGGYGARKPPKLHQYHIPTSEESREAESTGEANLRPPTELQETEEEMQLSDSVPLDLQVRDGRTEERKVGSRGRSEVTKRNEFLSNFIKGETHGYTENMTVTPTG